MNSNSSIGLAATYSFRGLSLTDNSSISLPKEDIYVDTNSWFDIAANRNHGQDVEAFLRKFVSQEGIPIVLWSPHNGDELMQCIHVDEYRAEAIRRGFDADRWKHIENTLSVHDKNAIHTRVIQRYDALLSTLKDSIFEISNKVNVMPTTREIMMRYAVPYKDAKHLAHMWHEETNNMLTRDRGFTKIPGLNIYSSQIRSNGMSNYSIEEFMPDLPKSLKQIESDE